MKKVLLLMMLFASINFAKAQWGGGGHHQHHQPYYGGGNYHPPRVVFAPSFGCGNRNRPFINVVIAPRPRVVYNQPSCPPPPPQPRIERVWVEAHYEDTPNGRIWVEGHYIEREVY